jgi:hypothetical protein
MVGHSSSDDGSSEPRPEHALLSLGTLAHPEWVPFLARLGIEPQPVEVAVANLSVLPLYELERLRVLHDLGKAGRLREMAESVRTLATGVIDPDQFDENFSKLVDLASEPGLSFKEFVSSVNQQGIGTTALVTVDPEAVCRAGSTGPGPNPPTRIFGSFEASGHPHDFAYGADPLHWPDCNPFFISMTPGPKQALPPVDDVKGTSYKTRLTEVVAMGLVKISTHLDVRYFVAKDAVGMDYAFAGGDGRIDVDHGYLIVEVHPSRENWVLVQSQKTVRFVGLTIPADLVCAWGWIHVMQNMASCAPPN